jgi:penicillin-binding protein 1A
MEIKTEQYYPTYKFNSEKRDVVLIEFEESLKIANSQTKVYGQLTNILLAFVTILLSILLNQNFNPELSINIFRENSILFSIIIFLFGSFILRYFVDLQKQITINARKAVTLRAMLGLDYGHINLTIPNWRVEGATNPFVIKFFNGWFRFQSVPFWVLTIGVNAIWWISTINQLSFNIQFSENITFVFYQWYGYLIISITYLFVFRTNLNDTHETNFINIVRWFARLINFKLVENFEYIIYRAKLDVIEMSRLKVNYENLKSILVEIEDKTFYSNCGVSFKSLIRATISQIKPLRKKFKLIESGGSTITMQLARSLFINTKQNNFLRKVFEILLAFWINKI